MAYPSEQEAKMVEAIKTALYEVAEDGYPDKVSTEPDDISPGERVALFIESNTGSDMDMARRWVDWYQQGVQMGLATLSHQQLAEAVAETLVQRFGPIE